MLGPVNSDGHRIDPGGTIGQREVLRDVLAYETNAILGFHAGADKRVGDLAALGPSTT